ncbi:MAG: DUF4900 domain-containing protein [Candidatus Omnitrophota bacterium]
MGRKGIVLVISLAVMAVLLILTGSFFFSLISESGFVNREKYIVQAVALAEAGASHARAELNRLLNINLDPAVSVDQTFAFRNYYASNDSLEVLEDYLGFSTAGCPVGSCIGVSASPTQLRAQFPSSVIDGSYNAIVIVTQNGNPERIIMGSDERYIFRYNYAIESTGSVTKTVPATAKTIRLSGGSFTVNIRRDNFAKFALFTSHHRTPSGTTVWFTSNTNFSGPVFTNERFSFAQNPGAHFTEEVAQHETRARFYNNNNPVLLNADSNPPRDVPAFDKGFERGEDLLNLESSTSATELRNEALGTLPLPGSNGIYIPNDGASLTGGIYVRGNSVISAGVDANNLPVYTITQGATTKVITVDYANNQTLVNVGGDVQAYNGIPDGVDNQGTIIYGDGNINGLSGTVQQDTSLTIASRDDIVITGNLVYQQYDTSPTLNAAAYENILGILSWDGDVRIGTSAPNNINIHGVVMAPHGIFTVDNYNYGSPRGTATLLGGAITDYYGAFGTFSGSTEVSGYGRNFIYDGRVLEGKTPPYFPYMTGFTASVDGLSANLPVWQDEGL